MEKPVERALTRQHSVIVLDVMLPKKNGFEVCRELRQAGVDTAILMLTAKTLVGDRVTGLRLGADDYLAKPFDSSELLARIEALLRRVEKRSRVPVKSFAFDDVEIDLSAPKSAVPAVRSRWLRKSCNYFDISCCTAIACYPRRNSSAGLAV